MKTDRQIEAEYKTFIEDTGGQCWRCGRTAKDQPRWWNAPFGVEKAHIETCNHPRREDARCVLALCSLCHKLQHGYRFPQMQPSDKPLTLPEQLAIKKWVQPEAYDRAFLKTCITGVYLPRAATLTQAEAVSWAVRNLRRSNHA